MEPPPVRQPLVPRLQEPIATTRCLQLLEKRHRHRRHLSRHRLKRLQDPFLDLARRRSRMAAPTLDRPVLVEALAKTMHPGSMEAMLLLRMVADPSGRTLDLLQQQRRLQRSI